MTAIWRPPDPHGIFDCYPVNWHMADKFSRLMQSASDIYADTYRKFPMDRQGAPTQGWLQFNLEADVGAGHVYRLRSELYRFSEDFGLVVSDIDFPMPFQADISGGGWVAIQACISGATTHQTGDQKQRWSGPCLSMYSLPKGGRKVMSTDSPQRLQVATVIMRPDYLQERFPDITSRLPVDIDSSSSAASLSARMPMPSSLLPVVLDILTDESDTATRRLTFEAKALQILASVLSPQTDREVQKWGIVSRDLMRLQRAREFLDANFVEPPSLADLGRMVGLNRRKLSEGFKQAYGETVYQYCIKRRMKRAQHLLLSDRLSVTETAFEVGYADPGNFSKTFKQHFGVAPRSVQPVNLV